MAKVLHLDELPRLPAPLPLLGHALLKQRHLLKQLCFLADEYGDGHTDILQALEQRILRAANRSFARGAKHIRITTLRSHGSKNHRVQLQLVDTAEGLRPLPAVTLNIYPASRRVKTDGEEHDTDD